MHAVHAPAPADGISRVSTRQRTTARSILVLTATVVLTAAAQRWLYAGLGIDHSSGGQCAAEQTDMEGGVEDAGFVLPKEEWDPPGCSPPALRTEHLAVHGCELWTDLCFDQGRTISWAPERAPNTRNFSDRVLLAPRRHQLLPGYSASVPEAEYEVPDPVMRMAALLPGAEQPDIEARRFSECTLPLVWWPRPAADASTSFLESLVPFWEAAVGEAPLLGDRRIKFVPDTDGFALPPHLRWLLLPLSKRQVEDLHTLSARRPQWKQPARRCFRRVLFCGAGAAFSKTAEEMRAAGEDPPPELSGVPRPAPLPPRPFAAGQWVAAFFERTYPLTFTEADGSEGGGGTQKRVQVLLATAHLSNADEALAACNGWTPQGAAEPALCKGHAFDEGGLPADVAALRQADFLVGTPAAPLAYGFMMRNGSAVLQLLPPEWPGGAPLQPAFEAEQAIRLLEFTPPPELWQPGPKAVRQKELGLTGQWPAEQVLQLDWAAVAPALEYHSSVSSG